MVLAALREGRAFRFCEGISMIYLASPYSDPDPKVMERRFQLVCLAAARLMQRGLQIFSPIAHSHPIALAGLLPKGFDYWEKFDRTMLGACDELMVLCLDNWTNSVGINAELKIAEELGIRITYMSANICFEPAPPNP